MKRSLLAIAVLATLGLGACSSTKTDLSGTVSAGPQQAISEQRLQSDFKRQGVRVIYSLTGNLEALEVTAYAPVWGNSENAAREAFRTAELEAKKQVNDFINRESIASTTSVVMISKNLEKANDNKTNNITTNRNRDIVAGDTSDLEINSNKNETGNDSNKNENVATRNDAVQIATTLKNEITIRNQGVLGGLYLVEGDTINSGKNVRVVYRWDKKHEASRKELRNSMSQ